jgi:hypothetical protein
MKLSMGRYLVVLSTLLLANCASSDDAAWPSIADTPPELLQSGKAGETAPPPAPEPPPPGEAAATLDTVAGRATALTARLGAYRDRFQQLNAGLAQQAGGLAPAGGLDSDGWSRAQAELTRFGQDVGDLGILRDDVAADAAEAGGLMADLAPLDPAALQPPLAGRAADVRGAVDRLIAGLGALDRDIAAAVQKWQDASARRAVALERAAPEAAAHDLEAAEPTRPVLRKPRPKRPAEPAAPTDSGDRFKGRQALVTLTFENPDLDFEPHLRALLDKVRAQYPDIAFDIETVGAPAAQLAKVRSILQSQDIPAQVYTTPPVGDAPPVIRLYPR